MSIVTVEGEIVHVNVRLNKAGHEAAIFQNIIRHSFEFPEAQIATSRLDHHVLA